MAKFMFGVHMCLQSIIEVGFKNHITPSKTVHLFLLLHTSLNEEPWLSSDADLLLVSIAHACSALSMWSGKACM